MLYSLSIVLTSLMSFSPETPRPTAANVDQGARVKKISIEEQAFAPVLPLAIREHLLGLVRQGLPPTGYSAPWTRPWPGHMPGIVELFVVFRRLSDLTIVARTLIVQLQYITDVSSQC